MLPLDPVPATPRSEVRLTGLLTTLTQIVVILWGMAMGRPFLIPLLLASLLAFIATPLVRMLRRFKIPEPMAIALSVLIFAIPFGLLTYAIIREIQALITDWPNIVATVKVYLAQLSKSPWAIRLHLDDDLNLNAIQENFVNRAGEGVQVALTGLMAFLDAGSTAFLIVVFAILMVVIRAQLRQGAERIIAMAAQKVSEATLIDEIAGLIQSFLVARFIIVLVVAALAAVGLLVFKVKYALLLGIILGVSTLIPNIGFIIGMVPALLVALATGHSLGNAFSIFLMFMALALFEANLLTPKLVGGKLNINSLVAFLGLFAGGLIWGVWGMLLSIPLLGILRICLSLSEQTRPWSELLAEREDESLLRRLLRLKPTGKNVPG